ncbi:MAG: flavodoxin domain-containing protein [Treponemataceae bacterium]
MNAIVVFDSAHRTTADVAARIAERLGEGARLVFLRDKGALGADLNDCELVVLGGPVYAGRWSKRAAKFAKIRETDLAGRKFAYFSVGMDLEDAMKAAKSALPEKLAAAAIASPKFGGAFRMNSLNFLERTIIKMVSKTTEDKETTDWAAVDAFADSLAR